MSLRPVAVFIMVISLFSDYLTLEKIFPLLWITSVEINNTKIILGVQESFCSVSHLLSWPVPGEDSRIMEMLMLHTENCLEAKPVWHEVSAFSEQPRAPTAPEWRGLKSLQKTELSAHKKVKGSTRVLTNVNNDSIRHEKLFLQKHLQREV